MTTTNGVITTPVGTTGETYDYVEDADEINQAAHAAEHAAMGVGALARHVAAAYATAKTSNARTRGNMASPPTVTAGTTYTSGTYNTQYRYYTGSNASLYRLRGVRDAVYSSIYVRNRNASTTVGKYDIGTTGRIEFCTDAPVLVLHCLGSASLKYRFLVDDQFVDSAGLLSSSGSGSNYFTLDFSAVGGRAPRKIGVEISQDLGFVGAYLTAADSIWAPPDSARVIVLGDSITAGTISDSVANALNDNFVPVAADYLGVPDVWACGVGGTGYVNNATTKLALKDRTWDATENAPDAIAICMGINDVAYSDAQIQAGVTASVSAIRAALPLVPIVVFGSFAGTGGPGAAIIAAENSIAAAITALGDRYTRFVPVSTAAKPWTFGTGKQGATNGSGNSDFYVGGDATHPTTVGHAYLGRRFAAEFVDAMIAIGL